MPARPEALRRYYTVGLVLLVLHVALLFFDSRGSQPGPVADTLDVVTAPVNAVVTSAGRSVNRVWTDYLALTGVRDENRRLREENNALKGQIATLKRLDLENRRLSGLLEIAESRKDLRLRVARVASRSRSRHYRVIGLELDSTEGIEVGMAVVAQGGLVGQVRAINDGRASVLLVTDPRSAVDVLLERSRVRGIAVGSGHPNRYSAQLRYVNRAAKAAPNEAVITTGDDGRFPPGLVMGKVAPADVAAPAGGRDVQVNAAVDFDDLDMVYIVLGTTGLTPSGDDYVTGRK